MTKRKNRNLGGVPTAKTKKLPPIHDATYEFNDIPLRMIVTFPTTNAMLQDFLRRLCYLRKIKMTDEEVTPADPMVVYVTQYAQQSGYKLTDDNILNEARKLHSDQRDQTMMDATFLALFANKYNEEVIKNQPISDPPSVDDEVETDDDDDYMLDFEEDNELEIPPLDIYYQMDNILEIRANKLRGIIYADVLQFLRLFGKDGIVEKLPIGVYRAVLESDNAGFPPK